jgi:hypothetical protein
VLDIQYDAETDYGAITLDTGKHVGLQFQHGPIEENGVNGIQNEDVLKLLLIRMAALQQRMACRENSIAITHMETALLWLEHRTRNRVLQGVEGTEQPHRSPGS